MSTGEDLRRLALALPGTVESPHFDRLAFKVARTFATLAADRRSANIRFTPDEQTLKCLTAPEVFSPVPNAWGQQGWTVCDLEKITEDELRHALELAWMRAGKTPKRR